MRERDIPLMEIRNLGVAPGGNRILSGLNLVLGKGDFLSIAGPNGAGKTTLLKAMAGLLREVEGKVLLDGRSIEDYSRRELARRISYVPQGDPGGLDFTVQAFVELGRYPHLGPWESLGKSDFEAVHRAMEITEIGHLAGRHLLALSGGERQRVLIAAALAQGGELLLLDEPTSFLDYRHQQQVLDLLDRLHREESYSCVMVTHDLNAAWSLSERILVLKDGRPELYGQAEEVLQTEKLREIFGVPFRMMKDADGDGVMILAELVPR